MPRLVLRARLTLPIFFTCAALGLAAAAWFVPSEDTIRLGGGRLRFMLPLVPFVVGLLVAAWASTRPRVIIDESGVSMRRLLGWVRLGWDDVDRYQYAVLTPANARAAPSANPAIAGTVTGALSGIARARAERKPHRHLEGGVLRLWARDGRTIRFGPGLFFAGTGVGEAFDQVLGEVHPRLRKRSDLAFTPIQLREDQLEHPASLAPLALTSIAKVMVADRPEGFQVLHRPQMFKEAGGERPWLAMKMIEVTNLWMLVEQLRARGVPVEIEISVFVPRDIAP